ncbi:hypothetical protein BDF20DRAFT_839578 [Mycotypha africana]|uniref:uncharacterized protein n=1 Tax=Mycotypha africana TaxID=64632 RepID=UPI0023017C54|nr:uncharacterized protein BDF20DRAFT_839578 [Mycotypha africana]KAI8968473.1 hypothetical protein BDF20DRAFT_839578 [Mycotypha africana]
MRCLPFLYEHSLTREKSITTLTENLFDIENAKPALHEIEAYEKLQKTLIIPMEAAKKRIKYQYKPATEDIRRFVNSPENTHYETKAEKAVRPAVTIMHVFYKIANEIDVGVASLLLELYKGEPDPISISDLSKNPGLTKLFADVLSYAYDFDNFKLEHPSLQNDFSFYKRLLQRGKAIVTSDVSTSMDEIFPFNGEMTDDDLVHSVSTITAHATPMTYYVVNAVIRYSKVQHQKRNSIHLISAKDSLSEWLQAIWRVSFVALTVKKNKLKKTTKNNRKAVAEDEQIQPHVEYLLKVMILSILLYDSVNPGGAFQKNTSNFVKKSLDLLLHFYRRQKAENGVNSLRNLMTILYYNSKHIHDKATPKSIQTMIQLFQ